VETPLVPADLNGLAFVPIVDEASIALAREHVREACGLAELSKTGTESLATVTSELAWNQLIHAHGGDLFARQVYRAGIIGVEVIAFDRGPGIAEPARALQGNASARAGMGVGLAGVRRLADEIDFDIRLREGTCIRARQFSGPVPFRSEVAILGRPHRDEDVSGDDATFVRRGDDWILCVVDGLGHGELAREASARATAVVQQSASEVDLEKLLSECHSALQGTRGVVMSVMRFDRTSGLCEHVCVGDIGTQLIRYRESHRLSCRRGIVGLKGKSSGLFTRPIEAVPIRPGDVVLAYSDGLKSTLDISEDAELLREHPLIIADRVLTTYGRNSDDALVLVAR
jgi:anti-sigma regulatory factor (Ser/Thr protein kinase)